jgi:hypothetical protein
MSEQSNVGTDRDSRGRLLTRLFHVPPAPDRMSRVGTRPCVRGIEDWGRVPPLIVFSKPRSTRRSRVVAWSPRFVANQEILGKKIDGVTDMAIS